MNILKKIALPAIVAGAGFLGISGASLISNMAANAATTSSPTSSTSSGTSSGTTSAAQSSMPAHGSASHEDAETTVTGDNATKAQAAAVKYVGSGTAGEVTTDYTKSGYETTVTKSDGSTVEVHLDSSFNVMQGGPGGANDNSNSSSTTN